MAGQTIFVRSDRQPEVCARCRERSRHLQTRERICLPCIEYLATEGGRWTAGDEAYMPAVRKWLERQGLPPEKMSESLKGL